MQLYDFLQEHANDDVRVFIVNLNGIGGGMFLTPGHDGWTIAAALEELACGMYDVVSYDETPGYITIFVEENC